MDAPNRKKGGLGEKNVSTGPKDAEDRPKRQRGEPSQLVELFLHVAEHLGYSTDRAIAELAEVTVENVANWKTGLVQEFKTGKLKTIKARIGRELDRLRAETGASSGNLELGLCPLEIERGASPADLQRQFRDHVSYDYLGHRFLYYEPMGALAWENLIRRGYDQDRWVSAVEACTQAWVDTRRNSDGSYKGPIADAIGLGRRSTRHALDVISLGPGEGTKELALLKGLTAALQAADARPSSLLYAPVDVSVPLLLLAATSARELLAQDRLWRLKAYCADFEEGQLLFADRLPTALDPEDPGVRLILMLGNTFGNLRDEEGFVRQRLGKLARPGDLVWFELGLRLDPLENDPLFRMTQASRDETAAEANRRLLLEGPYRRWETATGRPPSEIETKVWLREDDDSCRVPGSANFCHDLMLKTERRVCTMLYSRRYRLEPLSRWFEGLGYEVLRIQKVEDTRERSRVAHLLLRKR